MLYLNFFFVTLNNTDTTVVPLVEKKKKKRGMALFLKLSVRLKRNIVSCWANV